jgi:hypothetical protein
MIADSNGPMYASIICYFFPRVWRKVPGNPIHDNLSEHRAQNMETYEYDSSVITTVENHWTS